MFWNCFNYYCEGLLVLRLRIIKLVYKDACVSLRVVGFWCHLVWEYAIVVFWYGIHSVLPLTYLVQIYG